MNSSQQITEEGSTMVIFPKFPLESMVYLRTDAEQRLMMVSGYLIGIGGNLSQYRLECGTSVVWTYEANISNDKTVY